MSENGIIRVNKRDSERTQYNDWLTHEIIISQTKVQQKCNKITKLQNNEKRKTERKKERKKERNMKEII